MEAARSPADERERLRQRIAELRRDVEEAEQRFRQFSQVTNEAVLFVENGVLVDVSDECEAMYGYSREELIGKAPTEIIALEHREFIAGLVRSGREGTFHPWHQRKDGTRFAGQGTAKQITFRGRTLRAIACVDITERRRIEQARKDAAVRREVLSAQEEMIAKLLIPVLPISERVVMLPVIGEINPARASQMLETLTRGVFSQRAAIAILDITGIRAVDTEVADMLLRAERVVRLLGARVILTGVRPEVAETFVKLGTEISGIVTHGTLQQGVAYALRETAPKALAEKWRKRA